ncbi:Nucleotide-binding universal stress protein, UspA family [Halomicrobium zhouii]|uniref:Nucleotide-binding universal stress protein, UspA family n=1 Tax=Halomicrobium zhouii TaxID=767519 RepID=A0A1I6M390_9EURY|nr:universal stress protein [Halomicrobium zhouii]SFS10124.1 Nucleotide-binding universal stress protein, UspA family [Halomicrobium zhouii]
MIDTVLVPTDGSEHAVRAAEHGVAIAEAFDATLHVLTVVDVRAAAGPFDAGGLREEFLEHLEADAEDSIDAVEAAVDPSQGLQTTVREGDPVDEILDYAADHGIDLIAMGTHGRTGVERYVMGSVTEQVVRRAGVPVLTVRATESSRHAGAYDEVMIPTDGSESADAAVDPALELAARFDARVHAVHVLNVGDADVGVEHANSAALLARLRDHGESAVEAVANRAREAGVDVVTNVDGGYPASGILDYADENDVDCIAMGTAGRTGLNRFLLGSTTERVVRHANVPVLAVNARDDGEN